MTSRFQFCFNFVFNFNLRRFNKEYQRLRDASVAIIREIGVECGRGLHSSTFQLNLSRF